MSCIFSMLQNKLYEYLATMLAINNAFFMSKVVSSTTQQYFLLIHIASVTHLCFAILRVRLCHLHTSRASQINAIKLISFIIIIGYEFCFQVNLHVKLFIEWILKLELCWVFFLSVLLSVIYPFFLGLLFVPVVRYFNSRCDLYCSHHFNFIFQSQ